MGFHAALRAEIHRACVRFGETASPLGAWMQHLQEFRQEIADLTVRIAKGDKQVHAGRHHIRGLRANGRPTFGPLMRLSALERIQEYRRSMLATLERHRSLMQ